jgi:hypothetical protein
VLIKAYERKPIEGEFKVKNIPEPGYLGAIPALPLLSYMTV